MSVATDLRPPAAGFRPPEIERSPTPGLAPGVVVLCPPGGPLSPTRLPLTPRPLAAAARAPALALAPTPESAVSAAQSAIDWVRRGIASYLPASMPPLSRAHYRREISAWLFLSVMLGAIEGGVVGVIARVGFEGVVAESRLNIIVGVVSAAPAFANITSFIWISATRGRDKIRSLVAMQLAAVVLVAQFAFAPRSELGLAMLVLAAIGGRVCWAGVVTLRATVWRANYPRHARPTLAGRLATVQALMLSATALAAAAALRADADAFRVVYLGAAACGVIGALSYRQMKVRRHPALLRAEREDAAEGGRASGRLAGPAVILDVLRTDRAYRRYMMAMFVFGLGNLSVGSVLVIVLREVFGFGYLGGIMITSVISTLVMMPAIPFWSRLLDRMHILEFRAYHCWAFVAAITSFLLGAALEIAAFMWAGAALKGIAIGGGVLGWNLGHHDFAPPERTSDYMSVHVTLTGVRGIIGPIAAVQLYEYFEATDGLEGWMVFGVCLALSLVGAAAFQVMRRQGGQELRD